MITETRRRHLQGIIEDIEKDFKKFADTNIRIDKTHVLWSLMHSTKYQYSFSEFRDLIELLDNKYKKSNK